MSHMELIAVFTYPKYVSRETSFTDWKWDGAIEWNRPQN
jgi:hypothetical protein